MNRADYNQSLAGVTGYDETDIRPKRKPVSIGNLNIQIAYPSSPPNIAAELSAFLARKYKGRDIDSSLMGVIEKDVQRFVAAHWQPIVNVSAA